MDVKLLSVCMIVKNEEKMLPGCLESLRDCASEIIVVDTGSTDRTREIAHSFGAVVIDHPWNDDFADARNVALARASCPWILSIDADERLANPEELIWVIEHSPLSNHGYLVNLTSHSEHGGSTTRFVSQLLRLFRNDQRIRFVGNIHEQIIDSFAPNGLKFLPSNIEIEHLGYNLSPKQMHDKQIRNLRLLDAALKRKPDDAYMLQQRAKTQLALENFMEAERDTQNALRFAKKDGTVRPQALNYGGIIAFQLKEYKLAVERAEESLVLVPKQAFAYYVLGESYTAQNKFAQALDAYLNLEEAIEYNDVMARVVGAYQIAPEQLSFCIGRSYLAMGDQTHAEEYFARGLDENPKDVSCRIGLANCEMNSLNFDAARSYLLEAQGIEPQRADLQAYLRRVNEVEAQHLAAEQAPVKRNEKPFISLCMIVKNEEHTLPACLESVAGVVDEIVIVDTGSTDSTPLIAAQFGAKSGRFPWVGDFAKARNEALKLCTGEWIIYLDADERISEESRSKIRPLLESLPEPVGGLICTIVSPHRQADAESEIHRGGYPRIFRNYGYPKLQFRGRVHEQITPSLLECGATILQSEVTIVHTGYDIDRPEMERKVKRNYELLIKHVQEEPLNAYAWFQLGQTLGRMNMNEKAEQSLKFALDLETLSTPVAASAASTIAHICGTQQRYEEALKWCNYSLNKVPNQIMALNYKAYALLYLRRFEESEKLFLQVLALIDNKNTTPEAGYDVELKKDVVYDGLKKIRELRGVAVVQ